MPLISPPPPPPAAPRRRRRRKQSKSQRVPKRSCSELPLDALLCVFHRLDKAELMFGGASMACRSWRYAARQPELWRHIEMCACSRFNRSAWLAIRFSAGQCESFLSDHVHNDLILFLAEQAPLLKSLRLIEPWFNVEQFIEAVKRLPLLEELELSSCHFRIDACRMLEFCPQLKHYTNVKRKELYMNDMYYSRNIEAFAIARVPNLLSLQLLGDYLDNEGLSAILDNCPQLELLDLRRCPNIHVDNSLLTMCARINRNKPSRYALTNDRVHCWADKHASSYESIDDRDNFQKGTPIRYCCMDDNYRSNDDGNDCKLWYNQSYADDDSDYAYCLTSVEETSLKEHDRIMNKGTHRYSRNK